MISLLLYTRIANKSVLNKLSNLKLQLAALRMYYVAIKIEKMWYIFIRYIFFFLLTIRKKSSLEKLKNISGSYFTYVLYLQ